MMRNLIKKILKESDFDWIEDQNPFTELDYKDCSVPYNEIVLPQDINESDLEWISGIPQSPNYEGHPQGVTYVYSHEEIDEFMELLTRYNKSIGAEDPNPCKGGCSEYHDALEDRRDELEWMSQEDDEDYGEAMLSLSFFIESKFPDKLSTGYWNYEVDRDDVQEWLGYGGTHNTDYQIYQSLSDMKALFSGILKEESNELEWIKDTEPPMWDRNKWYFMDVSNMELQAGPWSMSSYSELTINDVINKMGELGYDNDFIPSRDVKFLYFMPDVENVGEKDYLVDYSVNQINGVDRYQEITPEEWEEMIKNYETKKGGDWWRDF